MVVTVLMDLIIALDIVDHEYVEGYFHSQIEKMAADEKLVRKHGTGFYNYSGSTAELIAIGASPSERRTCPSSYPGGEVASSWNATAWVLGEGGGWFQPLTAPKYTPTWLQIYSLTWFFGLTGRYQTNILWNVRNGIKPNFAALHLYEQISRRMSNNLEAFASTSALLALQMTTELLEVARSVIKRQGDTCRQN